MEETEELNIQNEQNFLEEINTSNEHIQKTFNEAYRDYMQLKTATLLINIGMKIIIEGTRYLITFHQRQKVISSIEDIEELLKVSSGSLKSITDELKRIGTFICLLVVQYILCFDLLVHGSLLVIYNSDHLLSKLVKNQRQNIGPLLALSHDSISVLTPSLQCQ